ncbi:MAG: EamA family transporter [Planctomycetota bacterium]|jgi:drug/metabolite transporter (DMT)-like permease
MDSKTKVLKYDLIFLFAAAIWGSTFVAQRVGMEHVGPFTFIAVRFLVGSIFLSLVIFIIGNPFS